VGAAALLRSERGCGSAMPPRFSSLGLYHFSLSFNLTHPASLSAGFFFAKKALFYTQILNLFTKNSHEADFLLY
jgi:hypothetical protein